MLLKNIFPCCFTGRGSRCMYSETALAMNQRAVNKDDLEIYLKTTLLICLKKESDTSEIQAGCWLKKEIRVEKNTAECKETDFRITCYLICWRLIAPWVCTSPEEHCLALLSYYYLAVRVGLLIHTSHLGAVQLVGQLAHMRHCWKQNPQLEHRSPIFHPDLHWVQAKGFFLQSITILWCFYALFWRWTMLNVGASHFELSQ